MASLRQAGHFDGYAAAIPEEHRDQLLQAVAGTWVPIDIAQSHYRACESLALSSETEVELGKSVFDRTGDTMFGTVIRLAKSTGATPWTLLPQLQRFWERGYDGGGIRVAKLGPKEVRIEVVQCALADSRYFRNAVRGLFGAVVQLFCSRVHVHEVSGQRLAGTFTVRAQWA
jgi:hypothetical protein